MSLFNKKEKKPTWQEMWKKINEPDFLKKPKFEISQVFRYALILLAFTYTMIHPYEFLGIGILIFFLLSELMAKLDKHFKELKNEIRASRATSWLDLSNSEVVKQLVFVATLGNTNLEETISFVSQKNPLGPNGTEAFNNALIEQLKKDYPSE